MRRNEIIGKAIELGRLHGFVTFDQLNELALSETDTMALEDIKESAPVGAQ